MKRREVLKSVTLGVGVAAAVSKAPYFFARTARAQEGPTIKVGILHSLSGTVAIIEVSDTGPGVPVRAREHLFEAFQTSGRPGGSGLGLAIAAELVRAHGGDIHLVEGTIGATFRIVIPDRPVELLSIRNERARA